MPYLFTPPSQPQGSVVGGRLFGRMRLSVGQTLLKKDGFYTLVYDPSGEDVDAADIAYLGGHEYLVSDVEAADLRTAGYSANLKAIATEGGPTTYGSGAYGVGNYGEGSTSDSQVPTDYRVYGAGKYGDGTYDGRG